MRKRRKLMRDIDKFEARKFREVGMSLKECCTYFDVSMATLMRALAEMREKFGPEQVPNSRRHLVRAKIEKSSAVSNHQ